MHDVYNSYVAMCIGIVIINYILLFIIHPFEFRSKIINLKNKPIQYA